jgi:hypothetical protein
MAGPPVDVLRNRHVGAPEPRHPRASKDRAVVQVDGVLAGSNRRAVRPHGSARVAAPGPGQDRQRDEQGRKLTAQCR